MRICYGPHDKLHINTAVLNICYSPPKKKTRCKVMNTSGCRYSLVQSIEALWLLCIILKDSTFSNTVISCFVYGFKNKQHL